MKNGWQAGLTLYLTYWIWLGVTKFFSYSVITFYLLPNNPRLQDISDAFLGNQFTYFAIASVTFLWLMDRLHPSFSAEKISEDNAYLKIGWVALGIQLGLILLGFSVIPFWITGKYEFFGFNLDLSDYLNQILGIVLRTASLVLWILAEEGLFRRRILLKFLKSHQLPFWVANFLTSLGFVAVKFWFFDLSAISLVTLFLISLWLGIQSCKRDRPHFGVSAWITLVVGLHVVLSNPLFGFEFFGVTLLKYVGPENFLSGWSGQTSVFDFSFPGSANWQGWTVFLDRWVDIFSGGQSGILASLAITLFFSILLFSERVEVDFRRWIKKNRTS